MTWIAQLLAHAASGAPPAFLHHGIEAAADAGIGAEQRDRAVRPFGLLDHAGDVGLAADVAGERHAIDAGRHLGSAVAVEIGHHHPGGAGAMKCLAQRPADPVGAAGDDDDLARDVHVTIPLLR